MVRFVKPKTLNKHKRTLPTRQNARPSKSAQESSSNDGKDSSKHHLPIHVENQLKDALEVVSKALKNEEKKLLHYFNACLEEHLKAAKLGQGEHSNSSCTNQFQAQEMVDTFTKWLPDQEFLALYMRWAKKNTASFQTDTLAVVHCVLEKYKERFNGNPKKLFDSRYLRFQKREGSTFGHTISFTSTREKDDNEPSVTSVELANYIEMFANVVTGVASSGKIGMRNPKGSGVSEARRHLFHDEKDVGIIMRNLQEFHLPDSFRAKIENCIDSRIIAYQLCDVLFKNKNHEKIIRYSYHLTEGADHSPSLYLILVGVCLMFEDIQSNHGLAEIMDYYFDEDAYHQEKEKVKQDEIIRQAAAKLRGAAIARAHAQINSRESNDHDIAVTIKSFHDNAPTKQFLHSLKNDRARKYHLIQCFIYEHWLTVSGATKVMNLLEVVKDGIGSTKKPSRGTKRSRQPTDIVDPQRELNSKRRSQRVANLVEIRQQKDQFQFTAKHEMYLPDVVERGNGSNKKSGSSASNISKKSRTAQPIPPLVPIRLDDLAKQGILDDWKALKLRRAKQYELDERCESHLHIRIPGEPDIVSTLPVVEGYSADRLDDFPHSRSTGPKGHLPPACPLSYQKVHPADKRFISTNNRFSCVRPGDKAYQDNLKQVLEGSEDPLAEMNELVRAVFRYGTPDPSRSKNTGSTCSPTSSQQHRIFISSVGQKGDPGTIAGMEWVRCMMADSEFDGNRVIKTIGRHSHLAWLLMKSLQESAGGPPLGHDRKRDLQFSENLRKFLMIDDDSFCIEDVTICCGVLYPNHDGCSEHNDVMNDWRPGYTRTGVFQTVLIDDQKSTLIHVQFIVNFRKKVGEHTQSFATAAKQCAKNIATYNKLVNDVYSSMIGDSTSDIPTGLKRKKFDATKLPFNTETILECGSHPIKMDLCLPRIGCSRVLSYSMFIEPIVMLCDHLRYDQVLELCFGASLLNSPVGFHHVLMELAKRHMDEKDPFHFGSHPFFDWMEHSIKAFNEYDTDGKLIPGKRKKKKKTTSGNGDIEQEEPFFEYKWHLAFQGRFSTCGGQTPIPVLFGAHPGACEADKEKGRRLLSGIVNCLYEYTEWIDTLADKGCGHDPVNDMPMEFVERKMKAVVGEVKKVTQCQFEVFRLGLFTTIITGAGLLKPGPHLHQLAIPTGASYDHLVKPQEVSIDGSKSKLSVGKEDFDRAMQMIAVGLNIPYSRTIIETLLCEAQHSRVSFERYDWFIRGGTIFDLSPSGRVIKRHFGDYNSWLEMKHIDRKSFAFLPPKVLHQSVPVVVDDLVIKSLEGLKGSGKFVVSSPMNIADTPCNVQSVVQYFHKVGFKFDKLILRRAPEANNNTDTVTCSKQPFQKLGSVALLPMDAPFWTILDHDDPSSIGTQEAFKQWLERLSSPTDRQKINHLLEQFKEKCSIYYCGKGSYLVFQGHKIGHATISIPTSSSESHHVCILHEATDTND